MPKQYVTFGQAHVHNVNGTVLDHNSVAMFEAATYAEGREKAFELFGPKFCFTYFDDEFDMSSMSFFPRGLIELKV